MRDVVVLPQVILPASVLFSSFLSILFFFSFNFLRMEKGRHFSPVGQSFISLALTCTALLWSLGSYSKGLGVGVRERLPEARSRWLSGADLEGKVESRVRFAITLSSQARASVGSGGCWQDSQHETNETLPCWQVGCSLVKGRPDGVRGGVRRPKTGADCRGGSGARAQGPGGHGAVGQRQLTGFLQSRELPSQPCCSIAV